MTRLQASEGWTRRTPVYGGHRTNDLEDTHTLLTSYKDAATALSVWHPVGALVGA